MSISVISIYLCLFYPQGAITEGPISRWAKTVLRALDTPSPFCLDIWYPYLKSTEYTQHVYMSPPSGLGALLVFIQRNAFDLRRIFEWRPVYDRLIDKGEISKIV
ncbi:hypothetical protein WA026_008311 [Henosepilachna vigintioctopunctata]|uniref:Uncharacterized protein n=1 Tax=Henosepilachna vigintioctopunctata TaxID=420089 RepID=A0AAW1TQX8_9CUCU